MRPYTHLLGRRGPLQSGATTLHLAWRHGTVVAAVPSSGAQTTHDTSRDLSARTAPSLSMPFAATAAAEPMAGDGGVHDSARGGVAAPAARSSAYYRYTVAQLLQHAYAEGNAARLSPSLLNQTKQQMLADMAGTSPSTPPYVTAAPHVGPAPIDVDTTSVASASAGAVQPRHRQGRDAEFEDTHFIYTLVRYMKQEDAADRLWERCGASGRVRAAEWQRERQGVRLSPIERQVILNKACTLVERRAVSLVTATRLLRVRWPRLMLQGTGTAQQRFLVESILAWVSQALQPSSSQRLDGEDGTPTGTLANSAPSRPLSPRDAWVVLDHCAYHLKGMPAALVGGLATRALRDPAIQRDPEALITLLWSVHTASCPAPGEFWREVFDHLVVLDRGLDAHGTSTNAMSAAHAQRHSSSDVSDTHDMTNVDASEAVRTTTITTTAVKEADEVTAPPLAAANKEPVGHAFSGLTTRQLYRLLAVLRRAGWSAKLSAMHAMADEALRNIAFETETADFAAAATPALTRSGLTRRLQRVADLNADEFIELLTIAGELHVPFHVSAQRVADLLLTPMVQYLNAEQMVTLLRTVRQTHCQSVALLRGLASRVVSRGHDAPYALPLARSLLKTALQESALRDELLAGGSQDALHFFLDECTRNTSRVRVRELLTLTELLYLLARHFASDAPPGLRVRAIVDGFCRQTDRLLQLEVVPVTAASRLLEYTIMLGMRCSAEHYEGMSRLLETRRVALAHLARNAAYSTSAPGAAHGLLPLSSVQRPMTLSSSLNGAHNAAEGSTSMDSATRAVHEARADEQEDIADVKDDYDVDDDELGTMVEQVMARTTVIDVNDDAADGDDAVTREVQRVPEAELPPLAKAAVSVYRELMYMYERMTVVRASVPGRERDTFAMTFAKVGLYNIFHGALLVKQGHLMHSDAMTQPHVREEQHSPQKGKGGSSGSAVYDATTNPDLSAQSQATLNTLGGATPMPQSWRQPSCVLPTWIEHCVSKVVLRKIEQAGLTPQSSDDEVLHVLGQIHCDAAKVHRMLYMVVHSPLQLARQRRALWLYLHELTRRFGTSADQAWVAERVAKTLY